MKEKGIENIQDKNVLTSDNLDDILASFTSPVDNEAELHESLDDKIANVLEQHSATKLEEAKSVPQLDNLEL